MASKKSRDIEKGYSRAAFVAKLRRLADAIESDKRFVISVGRGKLTSPARAKYTSSMNAAAMRKKSSSS